MRNVIIASAVRTAIGKFGKSLKDVPVQKLGAEAIKDTLKRSGLKPEHVDEVIMGNVLSAGLGQNPARQAAIYANLPYEVCAFTVNKVCGSGMKSVILAAQAIKAGDADTIIAGGMESMTNAPYLIRNLRWGVKFGEDKMIDSMIYDGIWDVYKDYHMGLTGEIIAQKYGVTRDEADEFSFMSHVKAANAIKNGKFKEEILPLEVKLEDGSKGLFDTDECVRPDTSKEKLAKLKPAFKQDGILTAGNSSQLSDGAASLLIMAEDKAHELGIKPLAKIVDYSIGGVKPEFVMEAPIPTVKKLFDKTGFTMDEIDLIEHNEAFSTASVAVSRELEINMNKLNVNGGAVALGHPIGCSGARILVTLLYALKDHNLKRGLATACIGGGNAIAMIIEKF
jgi:acetyl-CoA C-acetyltransferase